MTANCGEAARLGEGTPPYAKRRRPTIIPVQLFVYKFR